MFCDKNNNEEIAKSILELDEQILHNPEDYSLYYERGAYFYAIEEHERAEADYIKAVSLGLDCTKHPYYTFSEYYNNISACTYSKRDKVILILFALFFLVIIALEVFSFICKVKTQFFG